jgi:hypothetical protein
VLCLLSAFGLLTLAALLYVVGALACRLAPPFADLSLIRSY